MASKIAVTNRVVVPTPVPLDGLGGTKLVRGDLVSRSVDVVQAFDLLLDEQQGQRDVNKILERIDSEGGRGGVELSEFKWCKWIGDKGASIVAPLHVVVQMLLMHPSANTKAIRTALAHTTLRAVGGPAVVA